MCLKFSEYFLSFPNILLNKKFINIIILFVLVCLFFNAFLYTLYNAIPLVKSDGWRFIQIYLIPWSKGELKLLDLWSDHHPLPLHALLFIINSDVFSLRMDFEALFAVSFSPFSLLLLSCFYDSSIYYQPKSIFDYIFIIIIGALLFSLTSTAVYTWSLVTIGYIFLFVSLLYIREVQNLITTSIAKVKYAGCIFSGFVFLALFTDGAKIILFSLFVLIFIIFIIEKENKYLFPIIAILSSIFLFYIFFYFLNVTSQYNDINTPRAARVEIEDIPVYIYYLGSGFLSAWVNIKTLIRSYGVSPLIIQFLGALIVVFYLYILYLFYRKKIYKKTIIPGVLIIYAFTFGVTVSIFRFDPATQPVLSGNVPRYYLSYLLAIIGVIWILLLIIRENNENKIFIKVLTGVVMCTILISQVLSSFSAWNEMGARHKLYVNTYDVMIMNSRGDYSKKPARFMVGGNYPEPYITSLQYLKKNNLNLFSENDFIDKYR